MMLMDLQLFAKKKVWEVQEMVATSRSKRLGVSKVTMGRVCHGGQHYS